MHGGVYIGTSGWSYKTWDKNFYPDDVPKRSQFEFYATQFPTVEINATFYRLPNVKMVRGWKKKAPEGFVFAVKGSRFITHMKKLKGVGNALRRYFSRIKHMKECVGVVLWQLPPNLSKNIERLDEFLLKLPRGYRHAVEFRHPSWTADGEVFELLRKRKAAHVSVSSLRMPMNLRVTTDIVYIRFHGLKDGAAHNYTREELLPWAAHIQKEARLGKTVYVYFNNDLNVRAPSNARMLVEMVGVTAVQPLAEAA